MVIKIIKILYRNGNGNDEGKSYGSGQGTVTVKGL